MDKIKLKPFFTIFNGVFFTFIAVAVVITAFEVLRLFEETETARYTIDAHRLETPTAQTIALRPTNATVENSQLVTNKWTITFTTRSWPIRIYRAVLLFIRLGFVMLIVFILRSFVQSLNSGETFTLQNVRRLQRIGILLLLIEPFNWLGKYLNWQWLVGLFNLDAVEKSLAFRIGEAIGFALGSGDFVTNWMLAGMMMLVIAEVFKQGLKLKEEADLTV